MCAEFYGVDKEFSLRQIIFLCYSIEIFLRRMSDCSEFERENVLRVVV